MKKFTNYLKRKGERIKMSYDIELLDPNTKETILLKTSHNLKGGTYNPYGTNEAWLNITYNYGNIFKKVLGENGIRTIYGMSASESIPLLEKAIKELNDDISKDYWKATEGNAQKALIDLLYFAKCRPDGIWSGD